MEPILRVEGLTHVYSAGTPFEKDAVRDVSFDVMPGELLGIIGHTGSGKSTLIQHLNGLLKPTEGHIYLAGKDIWEEPKAIRSVRFRVGLVFQYPEYQLFEETVRMDVAFGPKNMGLAGEELERRVRDAMEDVGLDESYLDKSPFELSGGEKRRAAIAGVLAMHPEVLILDEPTAGLDPEGRENLLRCLKDYQDRRKSTVLMVSHSMDEIARFSDRILVMKDAGVLMCGTPKEVFSRTEELEAAGLSVPEAALIARALRRRGVELPEGIFTIEALAEALAAKKGGGEAC
ncbi:MAG: energy-coupling factor transporter ATPase [Oscillospiraceae bacterium]